MTDLTDEEREFVHDLRRQVTESASAVVRYEDVGKLLCVVDRLTQPTQGACQKGVWVQGPFGGYFEQSPPSEPTGVTRALCVSKPPKEYADPTPEMLNGDPLFEAIWQTIKTWDLNVPGWYAGYCGAMGNHARAIYDAVLSVRTAPKMEDKA